MSKILFARSSNDAPSYVADIGFDPMEKFKLHGDSRVAAAGAAGHEYIDVSDGTSSYDALSPYYSSFDFDLFVHTGHGLNNSIWGDFFDAINDYKYVAYSGDSASMTPFNGKAVFAYACDAMAIVLAEMYNSYGAVAVAGSSRPVWWSYDPAEQGSLSDVVFASYSAPWFKFVESLIDGNTWAQAAADFYTESNSQIAYWTSGAGSSNPAAAYHALNITDNAGMFQYVGTFQMTGASPTTGTINVSTNLAGATFSLSGADSYSGSGTTWIQENATAGSYTITFGAVAGYNTPSPQTSTLNAGETLSFTATYTAIVTTGTINVSTNLAGATFSLTGANTYSGSGTTWSQASATAGQYTITFGAVAGYNTPAPQTKTLVAGSSITFTASYSAVATYGTVSVSCNIEGNFTISGPDTLIGSGTTWSDNTVTPGSYTIVFGQVLGYNTPASQSGTLSAGSTLSFTGTYTAISVPGTITVTTNLDDATFTLTGPETLSGSGQSWSDTDVTPGNYTIAYGAVDGYTTPSGETKALTAGGSQSFSATYSALSAVGTIVVNRNISSGYSITGTASYSASSGTSNTINNAPSGSYTITYTNVAGYSTPASETQTLTTGATLTFTGTYSALATTGTINVTTNNDSASFTITGTNTYSSSGRAYAASSVPVGTYTIAFDAISGYVTPPNQTGSVSASGTLSFTGNYDLESGGIISTSDTPSLIKGSDRFAIGRFSRKASDPKHYLRGENTPEEFPFSMMPTFPSWPMDAHSNRWEFKTAYDVNATNVWTSRQSGTGTALAVQNERGGIAKFVNGTYDDNYYQYFSKYEIAKPYASKGLWLVCGIRIKDADEADWFLGLCPTLTAGANVFDNRIDAIGFYGTDGSASINAECRKNYTSTQETGLSTLTDETFKRFYIYVEGTNRVFFYIDGLYKKEIIANIPDDEEMCIAFGCRNGKREANEFSITQIGLYQDI